MYNYSGETDRVADIVSKLPETPRQLGNCKINIYNNAKYIIYRIRRSVQFPPN